MSGEEKKVFKVLVVEDDPRTAQIIKLYLLQAGHDVTVSNTGTKGLQAALDEPPDIVVLDLMLPEMSGEEVCRKIREVTDVPVVMVTARGDESDVLAGLDMGADDYITKPFSPRELVARIHAVGRRAHNSARRNLETEQLKYKGLVLRLDRKEVLFNDEPVSITPTQMRLLELFMRSPGVIVSRKQIVDDVFGYEFEGLDRTVDVHIHNLRQKLSVAGLENPIHTIYGAGYRFE